MINLLLQESPDGQRYIDWLISGLEMTLALAIGGWIIAFIVGVLIGVGRTVSNRIIAGLSRAYVEIFRNVPLLVQMFLWYFVLPELIPTTAGLWLKHLAPPWGSFLPALICLGLYTASRVAEQVRAGIDALPKGQKEGAFALGLSGWMTYRRVIVPQALRLIVPSLTSEVMGIYKNTSVALTIGVLELTSRARQISETTFETFPAFMAATLIYLALALAVYCLMVFIDHRLAVPTDGVAKALPAAAAEKVGVTS